MRHQIKLLLSLVFISLAADHAKCVADTPSSGPQTKSETLKFGVKMGPLNDLGEPHCFLEWKLSRALGIQIGIPFPFNIASDQFSTWEPYGKENWKIQGWEFHYKKAPLLCAGSLRFYPDRYQKCCIYVSYIQAKSAHTKSAHTINEFQGKYRSILGIDYEFDWGLIVAFSVNKSLRNIQKIITSMQDFSFNLSLGLNLATLFR